MARVLCFSTLLAFVAGAASAAPVKLPNGSVIEKVDFERHVMGLLGRAGCNSGSCHGSFQGKGGMYLSLFGYSPAKDHNAFARDGFGRRVNTTDPDASLLLLKAAGRVAHGGGIRMEIGSWQYAVLREWIADGAQWTPGSGTVARVRMSPEQHRFDKPGQRAQLKVLVNFTDGSTEDLTYFCDFRVNDDYVALVNDEGFVSGIRPGDTAVTVSYRGNVLAARALVPVPLEGGAKPATAPAVNYIDREVFAKLGSLNISPSDLCTDAEFLRRVHVDTVGSLPSPDEVRKFLADKDPDKRAKKIDELLAHPMHAALWATKLSDITGNNVDAMEQPAGLRPKRSKAWHDWLRARLAENMPYDKLVHGILCATSRDGRTPEDWVKHSVSLDEQMLKGFDTEYGKRESLDLFWRKLNFPIEQMAEHTAAAFMGVRLECAQCHKHPFDRWTQADYRAYANVFAGVRFNLSAETKKAAEVINADRRKDAKNKNNVAQVREVYVDNRNAKALRHPDTDETLGAKAPGGPEIELKGDPREALFQWLRRADNPFFARSFVNRVWGHYFGIGLVEPVDNFSVGNPPSNPKLLDALAEDFIKSDFDIRKLERTVLLSRTYQLSSTPNESNRFDRTNFSRSYVRRMMAEVVVDVLNSALGTVENFGTDAPAGARAIEVASNRVQNANLAYVFRIFGRPPRTSTCDCERAGDPALPQTLYMMSDPAITQKIAGGRLRLLLSAKTSDDEIVEELFLATLSRPPEEKEKAWAARYIADRKDRTTAFTDIAWALINTREFILNH